MFNSSSVYSQSFVAKPQRPLALMLMVLVHIGLIIALTGGLKAPLSLPALDPTKVRVIDPPPTTKPKPIAVVPVAPWRPTHTATEPPLVSKTGEPIAAIDNGVQPGDSTDGQTTDIAQTVVPPRTDSRYPLTQPAYPSASRRMGEEGTVELKLYITIDGRVGEARIERSSGFARLDEAALRKALRSWRLLPARVNDVPVPGWHHIAVTFHLN
jgi:protein TonB